MKSKMLLLLFCLTVNVSVLAMEESTDLGSVLLEIGPLGPAHLYKKMTGLLEKAEPPSIDACAQYDALRDRLLETIAKLRTLPPEEKTIALKIKYWRIIQNAIALRLTNACHPYRHIYNVPAKTLASLIYPESLLEVYQLAPKEVFQYGKGIISILRQQFLALQKQAPVETSEEYLASFAFRCKYNADRAEQLSQDIATRP